MYSSILGLYLLLLLLTVTSTAALVGPFSYLVAFGDSFTDIGRAYYIERNGHPPPPGTQFSPDFYPTFSGGYNWAQYLASVNDAKLVSYAVGGAVCNSSIVTTYFRGQLFPHGDNYQLPTFQQEASDTLIFPDRTPLNTVYAMWFGTTDLGIQGFLGAEENGNKVISDVADCIFSNMDIIWASGGRRFVILGQTSLDYAPIIAKPGQFGTSNTRYFYNPAMYNATDYIDRVRQYVTGLAAIINYGVPYFLHTKKRWPGSTVSIIDVRSFLLEIIRNPRYYLDAPAITDIPYRNCLVPGCVVNAGSPRGYMW